MKTCRRFFYCSSLLFAFLLFSCSSDDDGGDNGNDPGGEDPITEVRSKVYDLDQVDESGVSGTARFAEMSDGSVTIDLDLDNTPEGGQHPAHIHFNTAAEGGEIALTLGTVDGNTGESTVNITELDDGTGITYDELLDYNGYINVHLSSDDLETLVAQGDIGQNELTGVVKSYPLDERAVEGISGTVTFSERVNGTSLATIALTGTPEGGEHPAHIHANDAATGGDIIFTFNPVNGDTGMSKTQVAELDSGDPLLYESILEVDGYVNVHLSAEDLGTLVAQGNIGVNEGLDPGGSTGETFDVVNDGESAYVFNGDGFTDASNPDLTLQRGSTYTFNVNATGHPFYIKSIQSIGSDNTYDEGVENNGTDSGTITFTVPEDAPDLLYYNCEFHAVMTGTINIED